MAVAEEVNDLYLEMKKLSKQYEFIALQEEYIKDELKVFQQILSERTLILEFKKRTGKSSGGSFEDSISPTCNRSIP